MLELPLKFVKRSDISNEHVADCGRQHAAPQVGRRVCDAASAMACLLKREDTAAPPHGSDFLRANTAWPPRSEKPLDPAFLSVVSGTN